MRTKQVSLENLSNAIERWEDKVRQYDDSQIARELLPVAEDVKTSALMDMCPDQLRNHLMLNVDRYQNEDGSASYERMREMVQHYITVKGVGIDNGPKPMDLDQFVKGKNGKPGGKGSFKSGKGSYS